MRNVGSTHKASVLLHVFTLQDRKNSGAPVGFSIQHYAGSVTCAFGSPNHAHSCQ